jgi:hypothetical protein
MSPLLPTGPAAGSFKTAIIFDKDKLLYAENFASPELNDRELSLAFRVEVSLVKLGLV